MVACFTPFLRSLLDAHLSPRTWRRHRDNLWLLGGEVIRRLQMDSGLRRQPIAQIARSLIGGDGGPLLSHGQSEAEQTGFDATCRKLGRFLAPRHSSRDPAPGPSPATTDRAIDGMYADPSAGRVAVKPQSRAAVRRRRRA